MHKKFFLRPQAGNLLRLPAGRLRFDPVRLKNFFAVRNLNRKNFFVVGFSKRKYLYVLQIGPVLVHWNTRPKTKDKTFLCEHRIRPKQREHNGYSLVYP